eukprot:GEZU01022504.1.p1 GENE.GEZU01022504.1~~GEZU01022504.1.p1  ORF type:complete len:332 (-),score=13.90 GEZU01022504.1:360-1355(-)
MLFHFFYTAFLRRRFRVCPAIRYIGCNGLKINGAEVLLIMMYALLNVVVYFVAAESILSRNMEKKGKANVIARYIGHFINLHFGLLLLPVTRNSIWVRMIGLPFERAIKYHRWISRIGFFLIAAHFICWLRDWYVRKVLWMKPFSRVSLYGETAFFLTLIIVILSLERVRRRWWDLFYWSHHLFIPTIAFSLMHSFKAQGFLKDDLLIYYLIPGFVLYVVDRVVRLYKRWIPTRVVSMQIRSKGVTMVEFERKGFRFKAGQYVFVNFPAVSVLEWHPFTISSDPAVPDRFTIHIKDMGDPSWTSRIYQLAENHATTWGVRRRPDPYIPHTD